MIKKITASIMLAIIIFTNFANVVRVMPTTANLFKVQNTENHLQFDSNGRWNYVITNYIGCREGGKVYPAYCMNRELPRSR